MTVLSFALVALAAVITAVGVIWAKVLKPVALFISESNDMLPILRDLHATSRTAAGGFRVLDQIADEFRTDHGSSLRDVVNRLDKVATNSSTAAEVLKVNVEAVRQLAVQDRERVAKITLLVQRLAMEGLAEQRLADRERSDASVARERGEQTGKTVDELAKGTKLLRHNEEP